MSDVEVVREIPCRLHRALRLCLGTLDEGRAAARELDGFDTLLEEGSDH